jgi:uroporphyrinogen decarboxylase
MGWPAACQTLPHIKGPTALNFASGRCLPIVNEVVRTGTVIIWVSVEENLDGIEMRQWSPVEPEKNVKPDVAQAGRGSGFIHSDYHGEIPIQVPADTLLAISEAVHTWGNYLIE